MSYLMKGATVYRYPNYIQFNITEYYYIPNPKIIPGMNYNKTNWTHSWGIWKLAYLKLVWNIWTDQ